MRVLTLFFLSAACCTAKIPEDKPIPQLPRVVFLAGEESPSSGSGVVISEGWVLTAKHVLPLANTDWETFEHPTADLALVKVPGLKGSARLGRTPRMGERLFAVGWHHGTAKRLTEGLAQSVPGEMSCPVFPGSSGGPVINERGELVGIISRVLYSRYGQPETEFYIVSFCSWYVPVDPFWLVYVMENNR